MFRTVAGVRDEFVPADSSLGPFPEETHVRVNGNHLEIVKPETRESDTTALLFQLLAPRSRPVGLRYEKVAAELESRQAKLSEPEMKELATALELLNRPEEAMRLLEAAQAGSTEMQRVLAGRLKRIWLADPVRRKEQGARALRLYEEAYARAAKSADHAQAFYNGINVAFMHLAMRRNVEDARKMAREVLAHCRKAPRDQWRMATEGEAHLYLGDVKAALESYAAALKAGPAPRQVDSMKQQAIWAARLLGDPEAEARVRALFESGPAAVR